MDNETGQASWILRFEWFSVLKLPYIPLSINVELFCQITHAPSRVFSLFRVIIAFCFPFKSAKGCFPLLILDNLDMSPIAKRQDKHFI